MLYIAIHIWKRHQMLCISINFKIWVKHLETEAGSLSIAYAFRGCRIAQSIVFYVVFCTYCLPFSLFTFGHCIVCPFLTCSFWLLLWYIQTFHSYTCKWSLTFMAWNRNFNINKVAGLSYLSQGSPLNQMARSCKCIPYGSKQDEI